MQERTIRNKFYIKKYAYKLREHIKKYSYLSTKTSQSYSYKP